jgi:hypothetical protein
MITVGDARKLLLRGLTGPYRTGVGDATSDLAYEASLDANGNAPGDPGYDASTSATAQGIQTTASEGSTVTGAAPSGIVPGTAQAVNPQGSSSAPSSLASLVQTLAGAAVPVISLVTKKPIPAQAPKPAPAAPWTTGEKVLAGVVVVGALGAGIAALVGGRKKNPPFSGTKRKVGPSGWHHKRGVFAYHPRKRR